MVPKEAKSNGKNKRASDESLIGRKSGLKLKDKVCVLDFEDLKQAIVLNSLVSPYFADIASAKRLKKALKE